MGFKKNIVDVEYPLIMLMIFYSALVFCLPVAYNDNIYNLYPWWAKKICVGKFQLHEILFISWFLLHGIKDYYRSYVVRNPALSAAICLIVLALWCGIVSLSIPLSSQDLGRSGRLLLNVTILLAAVRWAKYFGVSMLLSLVIGFLVGILINLVISFEYPFIVNGLRRLSGQNTPGVAMGIAIHLALWLFCLADNMKIQIFTFLATLVFAFACIISFSRVGWVAGSLGLLGWIYILFFSRQTLINKRRKINYMRYFISVLLIIAPILSFSNIVRENALCCVQLIEQKFENCGKSNEHRLKYFYATFEIILKSPLGVGYSGFYDEVILTDTYRTSDFVEDSPATANPHSTFLYYAIAGGIPGVMLALILFIVLIKNLWFGLITTMGRDGLVFAVLISLAFLMVGLVVPYLFNSIILLIPTAISIGLGMSNNKKFETPEKSV